MIFNKIEDKELASFLEKLDPDHKRTYLIGDGQIRLTAVAATDMLNKMRANHHLGILESYILGQAYIAGALLSSTIKGNDRLSIQIECGGPVKGISVEAWACGAVRGYLINNNIKLDKPLESFDTSDFFGPGFLSVTKYIEGSSTPFTGTVMLQSGNIPSDLAQYFSESEQTPTLFYISINFDKKGRINGGGGIFIQALPGSDPELLIKLQEKASTLSNLAKSLSEGRTIEEYIALEFSAYSPQDLGKGLIGFSCPCTEKSFTSYIRNLSEKEQNEIMKGSFPLELECLNCGTKYKYTKEDLEALWEEK